MSTAEPVPADPASCEPASCEPERPAPAPPARVQPRERVVLGRVEHASRVGDVLVVVGWHGEETDLVAAGRSEEAAGVEPRLLRFPWPTPVSLPGDRVGPATGFLAVLPGGVPTRSVRLRLGRVSLLVTPQQLRAAVVDVRELAEVGLAGTGVEHRRQAAALLAEACQADEPGAGGRQVAQELYAVRVRLRAALPIVEVDPGRPTGAYVDQLYAVDERAYYLRGWLHDADGEVTSVVAVSPEGADVDLTASLSRYPRPDVDTFYGAPSAAAGGTGFTCHFVLPCPSRLGTGWALELRTASGGAVEVPAPAVTVDPLAARTAVLNDLAHDPAPDAPFLREHAEPALSRLVAHRTGPEEVVAVHAYGDQPQAPEVTVLVPLYKRLDFLEHQLAAFVHDPALREADLVYVLDSPEQSEEAVLLAEGLSRMYDVPFRLVLLRRNLGFADANNVGSLLARGRLLLLLNSDVLPDAPGWLGELVAAHDRLPRVGAVGAKLLYEDDSLQHAGMFFDRPAGAALWTNGHYFKGLHRHFPPACVERPVPAVTGACLLLSLALWREVGGLSGGFVQGDYEDSDLCLRLIERGLQNWYVPSVEMYHLEGQSYPDELRRAVGRYNTWLQTHLWDAQVTAAMQRWGAAPELAR